MENFTPRMLRLRDSGYKLTNARLSVLEALEQHDGHMTSTDVLEAVAVLNPAIGRASVFRTLDLLTQLAIIRPTYIDSSMTPTYVLMPDGHHHHIICVNCNKIIEFENCGLSTLTAQLEAQFNVKLSGHLLEFYGKCGECSTTLPPDETD